MYETVIVGGGAAGLSCALSAAAEGANVLLLEKTNELGGTVKKALIHTIGGLFDDQGEFLNTGIPMELAQRLGEACSYTQKRRIGKTWVLNVNPSTYADVIMDWIKSSSNIEVRYAATVTAISVDAGRIEQIRVAHNGSTTEIYPHALVDTTGNASIVRQVDAGLVEDGAAMGGFIVQLRGLAHGALQFPKGAGILMRIRKAVDNGELPPECSTVWLDTGVYPDEAYAKFSVSQEDCDEVHMGLAGQQLLAFLRTLLGFSDAFISKCGAPCSRDAGQIKGEYCLTERDIMSGTRFPDVACRASWPIEHWHPVTGLSLEYLPAGRDYDIPLRSFQVAGFSNLWAAGKCLSAEPRAQASARVAGTCWAMGEAVGKHITG